MHPTLRLYNRWKDRPFGKKIISIAIGFKAPFFKTIKPIVEDLRPNRCRIRMKNRRAVHNHISSVHAIAMCNLCELTAGMCMDASVPKDRRWIPVGMEVEYLKIAKTDLTSKLELTDPDWYSEVPVECPVSVFDENGIEVMRARIHMRISDRKKK